MPATFLRLPPGSVERPSAVEDRIRQAVRVLPRSYQPRTRHVNGRVLPADMHAHPLAAPGSAPNYANRLLLAASPYLRQHAHNPVDWRPWGQDALQEALTLHRPVFLSVGYATCHWCHVMEHESFEDLRIAEVLNSAYIPVKVDREERPDVDAVYMAAVQALTGQGGWPMSVWLWPVLQADGTIQGLPFHAGTYFPPFDGHRGMRRGFHGLLVQLAEICDKDLARVLEGGHQLAEAVQTQLAASAVGHGLPERAAVDKAVSEVALSYDAVHGGRSWAPKFPSSMPIRVLLRHFRRTGEVRSRDMALHTLRQMALGGIRDHVGGGWHRYSTDAQWFAPHFEKMLYDQGLIGLALIDAVQVAQEPLLVDALAETLDGMLRELHDPKGAFYAATDADSEGAEGLFFLWTIDQLRAILGQADGEWVAEKIGATRQGTFEHSNIVRLLDVPTEPEWPRWKRVRATLRDVRVTREAPLRDEKILTSWNGLAISALAQGSLVLDEPRFRAVAAAAMTWLLDTHVVGGRLMRASLAGERTVLGFLEDHAMLVQALLDLYHATLSWRWLELAVTWQQTQDALFRAPDGTGYLATAADVETVLVRQRPDHDGAEPSGNSVTAMNLVRLAALTGDPAWATAATTQLRAFEPLLTARPGALTEMLLAVEALDVMHTAVLVAPEGEGLAALAPLVAETRRTWQPHLAVVAVTDEVRAKGDEALTMAPILADRVPLNGLATAYVCHDGACALPVTDVDGLRRVLN